MNRYTPPVRGFLQRRGFSLVDAEDLAQEVFVRLCSEGLLERANAAHGRLRSYLLAITKNVAREARARRGRRKRGGGLRRCSLEDIAEPSVEASDPEFETLWLKHVLERALQALQAEHPRQHEALRLRFEEGQSNPEVAARTDRTVKQVKNDLTRARKRLARLVKREIAAYASSQDEYQDDLVQFLTMTTA